MKQFSQLYTELDGSNKTTDKVLALSSFFAGPASDSDKVWVIYLLSGNNITKPVKSTQLKEWVQELAQIPAWLFTESYGIVGDLAETISLLLPQGNQLHDLSLTETIEQLQNIAKIPEAEKKKFVTEAWLTQTASERLVFTKLLTGSFRVGVSQRLVVQALSAAFNVNGSQVAHGLTGNWKPSEIELSAIIHGQAVTGTQLQPYPFCLAYPVDGEITKLGPASEWQAEWKWDGMRAQLVNRAGGWAIWSRGDELLTNKFPELEPLVTQLPVGTVIDGEIVAYRHHQPLLFGELQKRIGRKTVSLAQQAAIPIAVIAYDLLEEKGQDIRQQPLRYRQRRLEEVVSQQTSPLLQLSQKITAQSWEELAEIRQTARTHMAEGLMLKRLTSHYQVGRVRGDWWKWKVDPLSIDAVLVYAQRGHGRRATLYTDYTFSVWQNDVLVPIAKAYSGLTDAEINQVDAFIKAHTVEKFGPVRTVTPELVFEIGFESIQRSSRHKAGLALRFPRILRWRQDKPASEADTLETVTALLAQLEQGNIAA